MSQQPAYMVYCILDQGNAGPSDREKYATHLQEIRYRDLSAIARPLDSEPGKEPSQEQLRTWLAECQQINMATFEHRTVLPLRFGTTVSCKEEVQDFLAASYLHIRMVLNRIRGKAEFVVQLSWDLKAILEEIHRKQQRLKATQDRIEIGRALFEAAQVERQRISQQVHQKLSAVSLDSSEGKRTDDSMVMNRSYLVERSSEGSFDEAMAELGRDSPSYLHFKYVGPMPAYSFVPLEFKRGNFELIDLARKTLHVGENAGFSDIRAAYRTLSKRYHPDTNPNDPRAAAQFKQVAEAYEALRTYCLSHGGMEENGQHSFAREEVNRCFVMSETRSFV